MNDTDARVNDLERITEKLMILWAESETESKECSYAKLELRKEILELSCLTALVSKTSMSAIPSSGHL